MAATAARAAQYDAVEVALAAGVLSCTLDFLATDDRTATPDEARSYFAETHGRSVGLGVSGEGAWLLTIFGG